MGDLLEQHRLLDDLAREASVTGWDGPGTRPVTGPTLALARALLDALDAEQRPTDINVDSDGELTFDWWGGESHLAVSLSPTGRLSFIHRAGGSRSRGTMQLLHGVLPDELKQLIPRIRP